MDTFFLTLMYLCYKIKIGDNMKKGFTLAELLAVVILLGLLLGIVYPKVLEIYEEKEQELDSAKLELLYTAADQYVDSQSLSISDNCCVSIDVLDKENLIPIEFDAKTLKKYIHIKVGKTNSYTIVDSCPTNVTNMCASE